MKKKLIVAIFTVLITVSVFGVIGTTRVFAQDDGDTNIDTEDGLGICDFIGPICNAIGLEDGAKDAGAVAQNFLRARLNLGLSLLFIGIILIAVFIIVQAGIKYVQSQGDEGKIAEAQKAIKSVFLGIGVLFVGLIGIILVLVVFNGLGLLNPAVQGEGGDGQCFFNDTGALVCPQGTNQ